MKDSTTWIAEIEKEIERLKKAGRHVYFQFSVDMTQRIANEIERHFKGKYVIGIRKCNSCTNKFDINLEF
jgi:hypothetical protein